jgi:hypothetical protein
MDEHWLTRQKPEWLCWIVTLGGLAILAWVFYERLPIHRCLT